MIIGGIGTIVLEVFVAFFVGYTIMRFFVHKTFLEKLCIILFVVFPIIFIFVFNVAWFFAGKAFKFKNWALKVLFLLKEIFYFKAMHGYIRHTRLYSSLIKPKRQHSAINQCFSFRFGPLISHILLWVWFCWLRMHCVAVFVV